MSNLFVNFTFPVLNGPGPAVDTSGMGAEKTITCEGSFDQSTILVEASVDGGATWGPVTLFHSGDSEIHVKVSANFMRVNVSGRNAIVPFSANCDVAAPNAPGLYTSIPIPAGMGPGASVDVSEFGVESTFISGGDFPGASIRVEISEDNINWAPLLTFAGQGGLKTSEVTTRWVRANISGHPISGTLAMGSATDPSIVTGVIVDFDGVPVSPDPATTLDFVGGGVTVTDEGGGVVEISIPTPTAWITFRPFDELGRQGNTYTDWNECYAAVREAAREGVVQLFFDTQYCPFFTMGSGANIRTFTMPVGTWDMRGVFWWSESGARQDALLFPTGCFIEHLFFTFANGLILINNSLYSTPFLFGGTSPYGGSRPGVLLGGGRFDILNTVVGAKPMYKQGGASFITQQGDSVNSSIGSRQLVGNQQLPSPLIDMGGNNFTSANINFENNAFTSLAGAIATGPTTTLTAAVGPGDLTIPVLSTAAFPAAGTVNLNNLNYSEAFVYTSKDATNFFGVVPVVGSFAGPTGAITGNPVTAPQSISPGDVTVNVVSTTGFAAAGSLRINGDLEILTYTGVTATSFTGVLNVGGGPILGTYPIGTLLEPIRAVSTAALPVGTGIIPVDSTAGFPAAGNLFIYQNGVSETVAYTGITATDFTGVGPTVNAYGIGAIMERASSFRGGTFSNHIQQPLAAAGRAGTMEWTMPNLDLSTVTVLPNTFGTFGLITKSRYIVRTAAPVAPTAQLTTLAVAIGGTVLTVASTTGFPSVGCLIIGDGSELIQYSGVTPTTFTGCQPFIKPHAIGTTVKYGGTFSEVVLVNATAAAELQIPTALRSYGELVTIKEASGGAAGITVWPFTGQTIDGAGSLVLAGAYATATLVSNGVGGWLRI